MRRAANSMAMAAILLAGFLWVRVGSAYAASQTITYQGNIRASGSPLTGNHSMTFQIYNAPTFGALLLSSGPVNVSFNSGIFWINLDLTGVDLETNTPYLAVTVDGTLLSPREQLTASPFAVNTFLHSGKKYTTSGTAPTGPIGGDFWLDTSIVPSVFRFWNGSAWIAPGGSQWVTVGSDINYTGGSVAIGRATPAAGSRLHVEGADLRVSNTGDATPTAISPAGYITLPSIPAPTSAAGRLYFDLGSSKLRVGLASGFVDVATGTLLGTHAATHQSGGSDVLSLGLMAGTIGNAQIAPLAVDDSKITGTITAAKLDADMARLSLAGQTFSSTKTFAAAGGAADLLLGPGSEIGVSGGATEVTYQSPLRLANQAADPAGIAPGTMYFNATTGLIRFYSGAPSVGAWVALSTGAGGGGGGGGTVNLAPGVADGHVPANPSIWINNTVGTPLLRLETGGTARLVLENSGALTLGGQAADPGAPGAGTRLYYNTSSGKLRLYTGATYVDITTGTITTGTHAATHAPAAFGGADSIEASYVSTATAQNINGVKTFLANPVFNAGAIPKASLGALGIVDADVAGGAAIAISKLATSGNLGVSVVASSIAVGAVLDPSIVSVSGSKVTGTILPSQISAGTLPSGASAVIASSVAVNAVGTDQIAAGAVTDAKIGGTITDGKLSANVMLLPGVQTVTGAKTFDADLLMGTGQISAVAGQAQITVSTAVSVGGPLRFANQPANPTTNLAAGQVYFNSTQSELRLYSAGTWVTISTGAGGGGGGGPTVWAENGLDIYNTNSGNVGLGTASPGAKLDLVGAMVLRGMATPSAAPAGQAKLYFDSTQNKLKLSENTGTFVDLIGGAGGAVALQAATPGTANLGHLNISGTGLIGTNLGIGTTSPQSKLHVVDGDIRISTSVGQPSRGIIFQDGSSQVSAAGIGLWSPSGANSYLTNSASNVGIGTTSPAARLEVAGAGNVVLNTSGNVGVGTTAPAQKLSVAGQIESTSGGFKFPNGSVQTFAAGASQWAASSGDNINNTNLGNVGVGLASPQYKLHVSSPGATSADTVFAVSTASAAGEVLVVKGNARVGIGTASPAQNLHVASALTGRNTLMLDNRFSGANTSNAISFAKNSSDRWTIMTDFLQNGSNDLSFFDSALAQHRLYISGSGDVGIGTTAPAAKLHVEGTGGVILNSGNVGVRTLAPTDMFEVGAGTLTARLSGRVGIGTSAPAGRLHVEGAGDTILNQGGNVGIAVTNPSEKLDVAGSINFREMTCSAVAGPNQGKLCFNAADDKLKLSENGGAFVNLIGGAGGAVTLQATTPGIVDGGNIHIGGVGGGTGLFDTNVGIGGVTSPGARLHVAGAQGANLLMLTAGVVDVVRVVGEPVLGDRLARFINDSSLPGGGFDFYAADAGFNASRLRIQNNGLVGISSATPTSTLTVGGTLGLTGMATPPAAPGGTARLYFDSGTNKLKLSENTGAYFDLIGGAGGAVSLQAGTPGIPNTGHLNITGTGLFGASVGIRKTAPAAPLDVKHDGVGEALRVESGSNANPLGRIGQSATDSGFLALYSGGASRVFLGTNQDSFINPTAGNLGVGTASPQSTLDVIGSLSVGAAATKSTFTSTGNLNMPGTLSLGGNVLPVVDAVSNLGSPALRFNNLYVNQVNVVAGLNMGGVTLSNAGNVIPQTDNVANLGSAANRWANLYTESVRTTGNVGVGIAPSATARLYVRSVGGGGTDNTARFEQSWGPTSHIHWGPSGDWYIRSSSTTTTGKVVLQDTGGYVGIGTAVLSSTLTVAGQIESTSGGFRFPDGSVQTFAAGASQWTAAGPDTYLTNTAGRVGIGTISPSARLQVEGGSAGILLNSGNVGIGTVATNTRLNVSTPTSSPSDTMLALSSGSAAGSEVMVVKADGKLGLGAMGGVAPIYPLQVAYPGPGDLNVQFDNRGSGLNRSTRLRFAKGGTDQWVLMNDTGGSGLDDFSIFNIGAGAHRMYVAPSGNIGLGGAGVGNTTPGALMDVRFKDGTTNLYRASDGTGQYRWRVDQLFNEHMTNASGTDTAVFTNTGNLALGTGAVPASRLHVLDGDIRISTSPSQPSRGIIFQDGTVLTSATGPSKWGITGTNIYRDIGNVGIGTTAPGALLDVEGEARFGSTGELWIGHSAAGGYLQDSTVGSALRFYTSNVAVGDTEAMRITSSGYVGIGTTAPSSTMTVAGSMDFVGMAAAPPFSPVTSARMYFNLSSGKLQISEAGGGYTNVIGGVGGAVTLQGSTPGVPDPGNIHIGGTGGTAIFGNRIGIGPGATAPTDRLDIRSGGVAVSSYSTAGASLFIGPTDGSIGMGTVSPAGRLHVTGTGNVILNTSGNVGVGTTNPTFFVDVQGSGSAFASVTGYGPGGGVLLLRRAQGTQAAPAAVLADDAIATIGGRGYGATGFAPGSRVGFNFFAAENWTDAAQGTYLTMFTTPLGSTVVADRVRITSSGNVGIATAAPAGLFTVANGTMTVLNSGRVGIGTAVPGGPLHVEGSGNVVLNTSGNVGIGTTSPSTRLHVAGGNVAMVGGDVGIGTTAPLSKLHVVDGDIRISTTSGSRGIIFQDGSVLASAPSGFGVWTKIGGLLHPTTLADRLAVGRSDLAGGMLSVSTATAASPSLYVDGSNGNVGLGSASPSERLDVDGAVVLRGMATPGLPPASQAKLYYDGGKVKLSEGGGAFVNLIGGVGGAVSLQGSTPGVPDTGHINLSGTGIFGTLALGTNAPSQKLDIRSGGLAVSNTSTAGDALFIHPTNGRVGIGTTTPGARVHVSGGDVFIGSHTIHDATTSEDLFVAGNMVVDGKIIGHIGAGSKFDSLGIAAEATGSELFKVGAGTFVVLANGNTGVGTAAPNRLLHPSARVLTLETAEAGARAILELVGKDRTLDGQAVGQVEFVHNDAGTFRRLANVVGMRGATASDGHLAFATSNGGTFTEWMRVTNTGQVGIGTASPTGKLDVAGAGNVVIRSGIRLDIDTSNPAYVSLRVNDVEVARLKP